MDIQYKGYTAQPSDYLCEDGNLEATIDMVPTGGSLYPFKRPKALGLTLDPETQNIFIHKTASYTHYIIYDTDGGDIRLYHLDTVDGSECPLDGDNYPDDCNLFYTLEGQTMKSITAVGNIIIISTDTQLAYIRWNANGGLYSYIGDSVPDPDITFALHSEIIKKTYSDCEYEVESATEKIISTTAGNWQDVATAQVNRVAEYTDISQLKEDSVVYFPGLTLEAYTNYRFIVTVSSGGYSGVDIYGTNASTGEVEKIDHSLEKQRAFDFDYADQTVAHTDIYAVFRYNNIYSYLNAIITIQKGSGLVYGNVVKYTEDSYNAMMGCINDFVASKATKANKFIHPFFARYAVRLYDGTYSYISPPVLLVPNTSYAPYVFFYYNKKKEPLLVSFISELQYKIADAFGSEWDDIIDGVDIYVSQPIYPYDQSLEYEEDEERFAYLMYNCEENDGDNDIVNDLEGADYTIGTVSLLGSDVSESVADRHGRTVGHLKRDLYDCIKYGGSLNLLSKTNSDATDGQYNVVRVSMRSEDEMRKEFTSVAAYYRVKQLSMVDICNEDNRIVSDDEGFCTLALENGVLDTLATQVTLDEDNLSLYTCQGASLYSYNNRLHIFNAQTTYRPPKCLHSLNTFMTATDDDGKLPGSSYDIEYTYPIRNIWVYIKTEEGDRCVHLDGDKLYYTLENFFWFFYPDARAYKAIIHYDIYRATYLTARKKTRSSQYVEIPLLMHDFTTGAYAFVLPSLDSDVFNVVGAEVSSVFPEDSVPGNTLLRSSSVYVSEASNPFVFSASATVSVGAEIVYALATAAQPLSVGQFGEFPLYAFTNEGVWAFSLSDTGVYTARQPITRDVCVNPENILQLDRSVLFATDRGIMELSGANCECITDIIDNRNAKFDVLSLKTIDALLKTVHTDYVSDAITIADMRTFMTSAKMIYDYTHRRLFFSNPEKSASDGRVYPYSYVYDIVSGQWSFVSVVIASTTNSYPEAICILSDKGVVDFCQEDTASPIHCAALTRPMKFGLPDRFKTVRTIIQRGIFPTGEGNEVDGVSPVRQVLYGSNDLINWHAVASSNKHYLRNHSGTAYKYYRILLLNYLKPEDNLAGISIDIIEKRNNQLR